MQLPLVDTTGKKMKPVIVPDEIFNHPVDTQLLAQAVRVYQANRRQGTKKVKTRAEIARTTAKVWRQKGTGRARHGSRKAPIFVGGGVAHGPTGKENYQLALPRRLRKKALCGALTQKAKGEAITVIDNLTSLKPKTKPAAQVLKKVASYTKKDKLLIIIDTPHKNLWLAIRNLPGITLSQASCLNSYEVLENHRLLFSQEGLKSVITKLTPHTSQQTTPSEKPPKKSASSPKQKVNAKKTRIDNNKNIPPKSAKKPTNKQSLKNKSRATTAKNTKTK